MKKDLIQKVLESESAVKAEGKGVFVVSDEVELTVIVDVSGQEALAVPKVKRVTIAAETWIEVFAAQPQSATTVAVVALGAEVLGGTIAAGGSLQANKSVKRTRTGKARMTMGVEKAGSRCSRHRDPKVNPGKEAGSTVTR